MFKIPMIMIICYNILVKKGACEYGVI
jgi:hypothetical protein